MPLFTVEDLRTPEGVERVLRQFNHALDNRGGGGGGAGMTLPSTADLVAQIAPLVRNQLQAPGGAPLNLQSLLPAIGQGVVIEDTHANRLVIYPPSTLAVGTLFYETDRAVLYVVASSSGTNVWQYVAGTFVAIFANRPIDLGVNDRGFQLFVSVQAHLMYWTGTAWIFLDGGGGHFADFVAVPPSSIGWQLCDGTATDYLVISGADLALTAFTTPDEVTAPSGVYHKSIAAYTGTINAATAGAMSGVTALASTGISIPDHPSHTHDDASSLATPDLFAPDTTATGVAGQTGGPSATLSHPVTDPQHQHLFGTIAVDATGQPRNLGVLRYFRR